MASVLLQRDLEANDPQFITVRHGLPEHTRYVVDPTQDPGLAQTEDNLGLIQASGLEIATHFPRDARVAIATSSAKRAIETGAAIREHPPVRPFVIGDEVAEYELSEDAFYRHPEGDRSMSLFATTRRLAETAFRGIDDGAPYLILVTHEPVIRHLAKMHSKDPKTDYLAVTHL